MVEEFEPRRTNCVEVFRAGRAGEGCDAFRPGNGGGAFRAGRGGDFAFPGFEDRGWSRSIGGGGRRTFDPLHQWVDCSPAS